VPKPASAPPGEFSAGRARAVLGQLVGDGRPHPVGSPADAAVRERIVANLRASGYDPKVEAGFACRGDVCAAVENVVAELPGGEPGQAVVLMAHYDSVAAGPGVADDLSGVAAALEAARILKSGPPPRHPILFLLDEGEEAGLLGAEAFVASSPEARRVRAVVNLEARGTSGRSLMFETSRDTGWLAPLFAAHVARPATSSLFALLYDLLPNDTDFTVFKRQGITGFNFAFIGDPEHYHTAHDDLADLALGSLQHHGDNALALVRALAGADLARGHRPGRAVFFDLLGFATLWWPAAWTPGLAVAGLVLLLVAALRLRRKGLLPGRALAFGLAAWPLAVLATAVVALLLALLLSLIGGLRVPWPARPFPTEATFWFLACTVALASVGWVRRAGFAGLWVGICSGGRSPPSSSPSRCRTRAISSSRRSWSPAWRPSPSPAARPGGRSRRSSPRSPPASSGSPSWSSSTRGWVRCCRWSSPWPPWWRSPSLRCCRSSAPPAPSGASARRRSPASSPR